MVHTDLGALAGVRRPGCHATAMTGVRFDRKLVRPRSAGAYTVPVVRGPAILIPERSKGPVQAVWE